MNVDAVYEGALIGLERTPARDALVRRAWAVVSACAGPEPQKAHAGRGAPGRIALLSRTRRALDEADLGPLAVAVVREAGLTGPLALDHPRLRAVFPGSHRDRNAAPVYAVHRDTWYANPRCQLNWWLALHDTEEARGFDIFVDHFGVAVDNDSQAFDFEVFRRQWGWQADGPGAPYPSTIPTPEGRRSSRAYRQGEGLLFSAAHLHGTRPQDSDRTRWSIDFRVVLLDHHRAGRGAPDPDNRCKGSALPTYAVYP